MQSSVELQEVEISEEVLQKFRVYIAFMRTIDFSLDTNSAMAEVSSYSLLGLK